MARRSPRDYTGAIAAKLTEQRQEEIRGRAGTLTTTGGPEPVDAPPSGEVVNLVSNEVTTTDDGVEVQNPTTNIRVNTRLEDVTVGYGTSYSFEVGQTYRVPVMVAEHLEEKGYLWH